MEDLKNLPYIERLKRLEATTLTFRRLRTDMIEVYKHIHKYDKTTLSNSFNLQTRASWKHDFQLVPRVPRDGVRGAQTNSFFFRSTRTWNNLPKNVVNSLSVSSFKSNRGKTIRWNTKLISSHRNEIERFVVK